MEWPNSKSFIYEANLEFKMTKSCNMNYAISQSSICFKTFFQILEHKTEIQKPVDFFVTATWKIKEKNKSFSSYCAKNISRSQRENKFSSVTFFSCFFHSSSDLIKSARSVMCFHFCFFNFRYSSHFSSFSDTSVHTNPWLNREWLTDGVNRVRY